MRPLPRSVALIGCLVLLSGCINLTQKIFDPDWNKAVFPRCGNTDCTRLVSGNAADARLASVVGGTTAVVDDVVSMHRPLQSALPSEVDRYNLGVRDRCR